MKRGRPKKDVIKSVQIRFRIELEFRKKFFAYCKKNKVNPSKEMREFVLDKINENEKS